MTRAEALALLTAAGVPDPAGDYRRLFDWAYGLGQVAADPQDRDNPNATTLARLTQAVAKRADRKPVSQIIGKRSFWRHDFAVTPDVLDPRPDTEALVEQALTVPFANVLDLGTGSGAILLSLLAERDQARGVGTDLSQAALTVAAQNAAQFGLRDRAVLIQADWFDGVTGLFDLIVSNPPYIAADEMADLAPEVRDHEPHLALTPGGDGLDAYRAITAGVMAHLTPGGWLMVEIGATQGAAVSALFHQAGLVSVTIAPDLNGKDRVVVGQRPVG